MNFTVRYYQESPKLSSGTCTGRTNTGSTNSPAVHQYPYAQDGDRGATSSASASANTAASSVRVLVDGIAGLLSNHSTYSSSTGSGGGATGQCDDKKVVSNDYLGWPGAPAPPTKLTVGLRLGKGIAETSSSMLDDSGLQHMQDMHGDGDRDRQGDGSLSVQLPTVIHHHQQHHHHQQQEEMKLQLQLPPAGSEIHSHSRRRNSKTPGSAEELSNNRYFI